MELSKLDHISRRVRQGLSLPLLVSRSVAAGRYAGRKKLIGYEFGDYGRRLGIRLLLRGSMNGLGLVLTPVRCVRYFEYGFALSQLPDATDWCLDVSSPRLFTLFVLERKTPRNLVMLNPDTADIRRSADILKSIGQTKVVCINAPVQKLASEDQPAFTVIWSLSVLEHMDGESADTEAMQLLWRLLAPGGRLIVTVPVDRYFRNVYKKENAYGIATEMDELGRFFFQRYYDEEALFRRIIRPLGVSPRQVAWFGERTKGWYAKYEEQARKKGHLRTVEDPRDMVDSFCHFAKYGDMPGVGVCGLAFEKP